MTLQAFGAAPCMNVPGNAVKPLAMPPSLGKRHIRPRGIPQAGQAGAPSPVRDGPVCRLTERGAAAFPTFDQYDLARDLSLIYQCFTAPSFVHFVHKFILYSYRRAIGHPHNRL
jgi:hypothetical protein